MRYLSEKRKEQFFDTRMCESGDTCDGVNALSLASFLCATKKQLCLCGALFLAIYSLAIFSVNVHYFYSMLSADPLLYYLHGWYLLHYHTLSARMADNLPAFQYVGLPGYLRVPLIAASGNFAVQLRLIQATNILLLAVLGLLSSYLLYVAVPVRWKWLSVPCMFSMLLLENPWELNVMFPLSDIFFALAFCSAIVISRSVTGSEKTATGRNLRFAAIALFSLLAVFIKFTGLLLPVYALLSTTRNLKVISLKLGALFALMLGVPAVLAGLAMRSTIHTYAAIWVHRLLIAHVSNWVLNLICVSIPSQIIPPFNYFYGGSISSGFLWLSRVRYCSVCVAGCAITALIVLGMCRLRRTHFPEIILISLLIPVAAPIATSTTRYLLPMQFMFVACFIAGVERLFGGAVDQLERHRGLRYGLLVGIVAAMVLIHGAGSIGHYAQASSGNVGKRSVVSDLVSTYGGLDGYLSKLDPGHTRLVLVTNSTSDPGGQTALAEGKWTAICGLHYVAPDVSLPAVAEKFDLYAVIDYPHHKNFAKMKNDAELLASLQQWGRFKTELVVDASNARANGRIYRIRHAGN